MRDGYTPDELDKLESLMDKLPHVQGMFWAREEGWEQVIDDLHAVIVNQRKRQIMEKTIAQAEAELFKGSLSDTTLQQSNHGETWLPSPMTFHLDDEVTVRSSGQPDIRCSYSDLLADDDDAVLRVEEPPIERRLRALNWQGVDWSTSGESKTTVTLVNDAVNDLLDERARVEAHIADHHHLTARPGDFLVNTDSGFRYMSPEEYRRYVGVAD